MCAGYQPSDLSSQSAFGGWLVGAAYIAVPPLLLVVAFLATDGKIPWGLIVLAGIIGFVVAPKRAYLPMSRPNRGWCDDRGHEKQPIHGQR